MAFPLMALGAGLGIAADDINKQRAQQAQLQMQQMRFAREMAMLKLALDQKNQTQQASLALGALDPSAAIRGEAGATSLPAAPGANNSPYVGSAGGGAQQFGTGLRDLRYSTGDPQLDLVMKDESGGRNIPNYRYDPGHTAGGFFQITDSTWRGIAPSAGIDTSQYPTAMSAPFELQSAAAKALKQQRGLSDWLPYNPQLRRDIASLGGGMQIRSNAPLGAPAIPYAAMPQATTAPAPAAPAAPAGPLSNEQFNGSAAQPETQVAQAGPQTATDAAAPQTPQLLPPPDLIAIRQRAAQQVGAIPGLTPQQREAYANNVVNLAKSQWEVQKQQVDFQATQRHQQVTETRGGQSEPFNAQITLPGGKAENAMVFTKKGQPGFYYQQTGKRVPEAANVDKRGSAITYTISDEDAKMLAEQRMAGDQTSLQGLGWGTQGSINRGKVIDQMRAMGATGAQLAAARAEFSATTAAAQAAGRRGAQIGMAINELQAFIPEAKRISELVDRTQFPTLNSLLLSAEAGTGNEDVRRLALVTNEVINAYAQVATRGGIPTDQARASGMQILNGAFTKGQYAAALDEMMSLAQAAASAPPKTIKETTDRLRNLYNAPAETPAPQQGAPGGGGAQPPVQGARQAPDGNWYVPDPARPGKYLKVE